MANVDDRPRIVMQKFTALNLIEKNLPAILLTNPRKDAERGGFPRTVRPFKLKRFAGTKSQPIRLKHRLIIALNGKILNAKERVLHAFLLHHAI